LKHAHHFFGRLSFLKFLKEKNFILTERLQKSYPFFTKQQKKVAEFLLSQGHEAAFLSAVKLARQTKTSQATAIRFARAA
jgi:DNA-binding MurR/RpiR family transcriptional regulator